MPNTSTFQKLHSRGVIAAVAIEPNRFVAPSGIYATPGSEILGVSESRAPAGRAVSCITGWSALVTASGAIAAGAGVGPSADGTGRAVSGGAGAVALEAAADGEVVEVRLAAGVKPLSSGAGVGSILDLSAFGSGTYSDTGPVTRTWQLIKAFRAKPYAFRVGFKNRQVVPITVDKVTVTPSTTYSLGGSFGGDPTGGATPTNVLFGGSASVVLPAAITAQQETITWSDLIACAPLDRSDVVGAPWLAYFRAYFAAANYTYISGANLANFSGNNSNSATVHLESFHTTTGDLTTATGYQGSGSNQVGLPWIIEAQCAGRFINLLCLGDSTYNDTPLLNGGQRAGWLQTAASTLSAQGGRGGAFFSASNMGWPSQSINRASPFAIRLPSILAANKYDVVFLQAFSPNDSPNSQAHVDADIAAVLKMITQVRAAGAVPILSTGMPSSAALIPDAARDAWRVQINGFWRNYCAQTRTSLIDIEATLSNGANPARLLPAYSSDGVHITTDAGRDLMANAAVVALTAAL